MSSRRTVILIAAVAIGLLSAYLVFNYVNSADDRAQGDARRVEVLKISKDIQKGMDGKTAIDQGMIEKAEIPAEFKPVTAITDPAIIQDKVAVANFATGQILVDGMFADPIDNQITFAGRVPDDCAPSGLNGSATGQPVPCVGITIQVDQTKGVAGVIVPGDFVNILVLPDTGYCGKPDDKGIVNVDTSKGGVVSELDPGTQLPLPSNGGVAICTPARVLYQAAKVLFVDKTAVPQPGESTTAATPNSAAAATTTVNSGLITLEVPAQAAQLIASITPEDLYLTLLPSNYTPEALPKLNPYPAALPGEDPTQLTPYGPQGFQSQK